MSLGFEDCKVFVSTVDSQSSAESGIVVQVVGELSNMGGPWRKFAQTFFLAEQPNGYFVLNDIFRYIREEIDDDDAEPQQEEKPGLIASTASALLQMVAPPASSPSQEHRSAVEPQHGLQLRDAHGPSSTAAGVTLSPPNEAGQSGARASLVSLANGTEQQQQVVELYDEIGGDDEQRQQQEDLLEQQDSQNTLIPRVNGDHAIAEAEQRTTTSSTSSPSPERSHTTESNAPSSSNVKSEATPKPPVAPIEETSESDTTVPSMSRTAPMISAIPVPGPSQQTASPSAVSPTAPTPSAPKTWANLAASGQNKWKTQVMSNTQGVSSSATTSGSSTPATPGMQGSAPSASERGDGQFSRAGRPQRGTGPEMRGHTNIETGHSIIVRNVTADISHGAIRKRLSNKFARGSAPHEQANLSSLVIDRDRSLAFIDFEEGWPVEKAVGEKTVEIDGTILTIEKDRGDEKGRGDRRDSAGYAPRGSGNSSVGAGGSGRGAVRGASNPGGPGGARGGGGIGRGQAKEGQNTVGRKTQGGRGGPGSTRA